jgi:hypothetical protein
MRRKTMKISKHGPKASATVARLSRKSNYPGGLSRAALAVLALFAAAPVFGEITIDDVVSHDIYGNSANPDGSDHNGSQENNTLSIVSGGNVTGSVYGAYTDISGRAATGNTINVFDGMVTGFIRSGYSRTGDVTHNTVNIFGGAVSGVSPDDDLYGGPYDGPYGGAYGDPYGGAYGGYSSSGNVTGNTINISGGEVGPFYLDENGHSGYHGLYGSAYGGYSRHRNATGNTINISGGKVGDVYGGRTYSGNAIGNTVSLSGGAVQHIFGGYSTVGNAIGNTINLSGGTVTSNIRGGYSYNHIATGNTVNLDGIVTFDPKVAIYGGSCDGPLCSDAFSDNTLNVRAAGNTIGVLRNFEFLNFYLPDTLTTGQAVLTVTNTVRLADYDAEDIIGSRRSKVEVGFAGASSPLEVGDQVVLIDAGRIDSAPENSTSSALGLQGATLRYQFELTTSDNRLLATVADVNADERSKSLSEGYLSGAAFLGQGYDFLLGKGADAARSAMKESGGQPEVFAALGYGAVRHRTESSVAVNGYNLVAGLGLGHRFERANLTATLFLEYGNGDYDSHNSFGGGKVEGSGDTGYKGLGFFVRNDFDNGMHLEGSLRGGRVDTDYRSNDLRDNLGNRAQYDAESGYVGAHLGLGKSWTLNAGNRFETYAQGIWTQQGSESARLSTGEWLRFEEVDSKRLRLGTRYTHALSKVIEGYAGLAYEREFDGEAKATTQGHRIDAPKLEGNTGLAEIGLTVTPGAGKPVSIDFGVQGYAGRREGATGSLRGNYRF